MGQRVSGVAGEHVVQCGLRADVVGIVSATGSGRVPYLEGPTRLSAAVESLQVEGHAASDREIVVQPVDSGHDSRAALFSSMQIVR